MAVSLFDHVEQLSQTLKNWRETVLEPTATTSGERVLLSQLLGTGPATVPELARARGASRQHIQQQIDALLERGFVSRAPNPAHKRSSLFSLSDRGRAMVDSLRAEEREAVDRLRAGTSDQAVRDAVQVLSAWNDAIVADTRARNDEEGSS